MWLGLEVDGVKCTYDRTFNDTFIISGYKKSAKISLLNGQVELASQKSKLSFLIDNFGTLESKVSPNQDLNN